MLTQYLLYFSVFYKIISESCYTYVVTYCRGIIFFLYFFIIFEVHVYIGGMLYVFSPWNENLNLLVQIKIYLYIFLNKSWKNYWSQQSITGLRHKDCVLFLIEHRDGKTYIYIYIYIYVTKFFTKSFTLIEKKLQLRIRNTMYFFFLTQNVCCGQGGEAGMIEMGSFV